MVVSSGHQRLRLMSDKLKTIGVDKEKVWKVLKEIALEEECTLSEVIEDLIKKAGTHGKSAGEKSRKADAVGRK
jgi:macrodomain Ter protein organizer (MatP/YcbG family)